MPGKYKAQRCFRLEMEVEQEQEPGVKTQKDDEDSEVKATTAILSFQYNIEKEGEEKMEKKQKNEEKMTDTQRHKLIFTCFQAQDP